MSDAIEDAINDVLRKYPKPKLPPPVYPSPPAALMAVEPQFIMNRKKEQVQQEDSIDKLRATVQRQEEALVHWQQKANEDAHVLAKLKGDLADHQQTFDLRWKADIRAIKRWQEAHPGKELVWPDHADLCIWLMERIAELEALLGAADSLRQQYVESMAKAGVIHTTTIEAIRTLQEELAEERARLDWIFEGYSPNQWFPTSWICAWKHSAPVLMSLSPGSTTLHGTTYATPREAIDADRKKSSDT